MAETLTDSNNEKTPSLLYKYQLENAHKLIQSLQAHNEAFEVVSSNEEIRDLLYRIISDSSLLFKQLNRK